MTLMKAVGVNQNWKVKGSKNQNNVLKGTKMLRRGGAEGNWESASTFTLRTVILSTVDLITALNKGFFFKNNISIYEKY